MEWFDKNTFMV